MSAGHLSSLGLAGLYLEFMAARAACNAGSILSAANQDRVAAVDDYGTRLEKLATARAAHEAELERLTGLPADLIRRRLSL
jgi:hypothetical protein